MRSVLLLAAGAVVATTACSPGFNVRTTVAPDANLSALRTYYVLAAPSRRADAPPLPPSDPMLNNSITNRQLRSDLQQAFAAHGYTPASRQDADFFVAYYAGTMAKLDTTYWGPTWDPAWRYRYRWRAGWAWPWYGGLGRTVAQVREYTEGQLIVDVVDRRTHELVWRGQGVAPVSDDPVAYVKTLNQAVVAVLEKFPTASTTVARN
jgi:hypothetical protein